MLQSRLLCALKRRKDNPINCSLQIKALFCRFPPRSGPALLMTCPPTWGPSQGGPRELAHTFRSPNPRQWAAQKAVFSFSCWPPRRRNLKERVPLIFLEETGVKNYIFKSPHFFPPHERHLLHFPCRENTDSRSQNYQGFFHTPALRRFKQKLNESFRNHGLPSSPFFRKTTSC